MPHASNKKARHAGSNAGWMLTFADLLSLLLTFFVLIFSMSTIQVASWGDVVETMRDQFNTAKSTVTPKRYETDETIARTGLRGLNLNYLRALIESNISATANLKGAAVSIQDNRVIVSVPASGLFEVKDSTFKQGATQALQSLAGAFVQINNRLTIAAHTNSTQVSNDRFLSNWELSLTRAQLVAGVFADAGYQQPVAVIGHGDSKFLFTGSRPTIDELEKQERVDFVVLSEGQERGLRYVF